MPSCSLQALMLAAICAAPALSAAAQAPAGQDSSRQAAMLALARLRPQTAVRMHVRGQGRLEASFAAVDGDALRLDPGGAVATVAVAELDSLWVRGTAAKTGAIVGAITGALAGASFGFLADRVGCRDDGGDPCPEAIPLLGLGGAAGGALFGGLVGAVIPKWHRRFP